LVEKPIIYNYSSYHAVATSLPEYYHLAVLVAFSHRRGSQGRELNRRLSGWNQNAAQDEEEGKGGKGYFVN
jgi:hypothetical protein